MRIVDPEPPVHWFDGSEDAIGARCRRSANHHRLNDCTVSLDQFMDALTTFYKIVRKIQRALDGIQKQTWDKEWSIREIVAPNGKALTKYFFKRREALRIRLDSDMAKQLAGYVLIEKDMRSIMIWMKKITDMYEKSEHPMDGTRISGDRETFDIIKGLWVASLTFYGKAFTSAEGRSVKLKRNFLDKKHRKNHDLFMHIRHNFAAHGGRDAHEEARVVLALPPKIRSSSPPRLFTELHQLDYMSADGEADLLILAEHIQSKLKQNIEDLQVKILEEEILPAGKQHWYDKAKK